MGEITARLAERVAELEARAYELAGEEFMIGSTQQVARVLFEKLLTSGRKGRTGCCARACALDPRRPQLVPVIEEWRELSKLLNTYLGPLPTLMRTRTSARSTRRLLLDRPALNDEAEPAGRVQPDELGKEIRSAFVAKEGANLLSADYSQIELRILAACSGGAEAP